MIMSFLMLRVKIKEEQMKEYRFYYLFPQNIKESCVHHSLATLILNRI